MSLGPDARSLLAAADGADDPSSADEARIRAKIAARLAIAAGTGIAAGTAAKTAAASTGTAATTGLVAKIAIGVAVVTATTAGGSALYERSVHERDPVVVVEAPKAHPTADATTVAKAQKATAPTSIAAGATAEAPVPEPAHVIPTATAIPSPKARTSASASTSATDTVGEEAALLRTAHGALARGDGSAAMVSLHEHARRFPRGALAEEREAAKVLALCAQGRATEARASAAAFVATNPRSPFAAQVRRSCATKDP
jgi:hypothetical protein